jgi:hypothetical protein
MRRYKINLIVFNLLYIILFQEANIFWFLLYHKFLDYFNNEGLFKKNLISMDIYYFHKIKYFQA